MPMLVIRMIAGPVIVVVMRMVAMMVVGMVMAMIVLAAYSMMLSVVVVAVSVPMIVAVVVGISGAILGLCISAAFGIERRFEGDHAGAETLGHRLDDGIAADAQRFWRYFGRQVTVAEMPGDASERQGVGGPDLRQWFGLGDHLDHTSVLEPQTVAAAQHRRFRKIEQKFEPADAGHGDPPAITLVEVEHHRIRRSARPTAGRYHFVSAQHQCTFGPRRPCHWEIRFRSDLSLDEKRSKRQPACKPGSVWPGLIAPA
jgi:hypothetical protein